MQFKTIVKLLSKHLSFILHDVIRVKQSAFLKGHQILNDTLMVIDLVAWFKKKKKLLIFKVGFKKVYVSIS